jgi:hypothetical protein
MPHIVAVYTIPNPCERDARAPGSKFLLLFGKRSHFFPQA